MLFPDPRVLGVLLGVPKAETQAPGRPGRPSLADSHSSGGFSIILSAFAASFSWGLQPHLRGLQKCLFFPSKGPKYIHHT